MLQLHPLPLSPVPPSPRARVTSSYDTAFFVGSVDSDEDSVDAGVDEVAVVVPSFVFFAVKVTGAVVDVDVGDTVVAAVAHVARLAGWRH